MSDSTLTTPSGLKVIEVIAYGLTDHPSGPGRLAAVLVEQSDGTRSVEVLPMASLTLTSKVVEVVNEMFNERDRAAVHYFHKVSKRSLCGVAGTPGRWRRKGAINNSTEICALCEELMDLYLAIYHETEDR